MKIIFLNGPPRSGKDFAGRLICERAAPLVASCQKFAERLKEITHAVYTDFCDYDIYPERHDAYEAVKDEPRVEFWGITPRAAYIAVSERLLKPLHGEDVLGRLLLKDLQGTPYSRKTDLVCITDSGFAAEAAPIIAWAGVENCTLIRLHREGCPFEGDSRSYISLPGVRTFDIVNDGTIGGLETELRNAGVIS